MEVISSGDTDELISLLKQTGAIEVSVNNAEHA
jgi:hypothetical protein